MKILVIAPFYRWFIKDIVEAQSKYLDEIHVLVHHNYLVELSRYLPFGGYLNHAKLYSKRNIVNFSETPDNVYVHIISTLYFVPDGRNKKIGDKIAEMFSRYIIQNELEFDIIHAHFTWPQGYAAIKLGEKFNAPVVATLHENMMFLNSILNRVSEKARNVWKRADALIRVNKRDIPLYISQGADPSKIHYIPTGYNPKKVHHIPQHVAREKLGLPLESKIIFNLARLHPAKGHRYLISAMKHVIEHKKDVMCYIGGTGPEESKLHKQIKKLNLERHVKLLGYLPDNEIKYWMNAADIFVLPSLTEGNPTVMFEALGVGLPFIGTKVGGVPEIIISEDYGLLVEPANPKDLAEKILIALEKEWDREKIRKYAKQFTWERIALKILNIYRKVLNSAQG